jgi:NADH-quinone oxidoreductase subunit J
MAERLVPLAIGCLAALLTGLGVVLLRRPVHCAFLLLLHSLSIAALYLMLSADFVAMGQVTIYSGAIVVLFLFVVLLLPERGEETRANMKRVLVALVGGGVMATALLPVASLAAAPAAVPPEPGFSVEALAGSLFGAQLVPFELTAVLLLVAIVGGVALWNRGAAEGRR